MTDIDYNTVAPIYITIFGIKPSLLTLEGYAVRQIFDILKALEFCLDNFGGFCFVFLTFGLLDISIAGGQLQKIFKNETDKLLYILAAVSKKCPSFCKCFKMV